MSDEDSFEHHTTPAGPHVPQQFGPERSEKPLPDDVSFIDAQLRMWAHSPAYRGELVEKVLAETDEISENRPGISPLAKRWEVQLSEFANNTELDANSLEDDPYEKVFAVAKTHADQNTPKLLAIDRIERLYKHRQLSMDTKQQYEAPLPEDLVAILKLILNQ